MHTDVHCSSAGGGGSGSVVCSACARSIMEEACCGHCALHPPCSAPSLQNSRRGDGSGRRCGSRCRHHWHVAAPLSSHALVSEAASHMSSRRAVTIVITEGLQRTLKGCVTKVSRNQRHMRVLEPRQFFQRFVCPRDLPPLNPLPATALAATVRCIVTRLAAQRPNNWSTVTVTRNVPVHL